MLTNLRAPESFKALAAEGKSTGEIAEALKISYQVAAYQLRKLSITPVLLKRGPKIKEPSPEAVAHRAVIESKKVALAEKRQKMAAMYRQGLTLDAIGRQYGITRQAIEQHLKAVGVNRKDGGQSFSAARKRERKDREIQARYMSKYGLPLEVMQQLRADRVTHAYSQQRISARNRGIKWDLDFSTWFAIWQASGKLHLRGKGKGKYVMSRIKDDGPYVVGNVHIQLATENSREAVSKWKGKTKENRGVFLLYPGRELAWLAKAGRKSLGFYRTEAEAVNAREDFFAANPDALKVNRGLGYSHIKASDGRAERFQVMVGRKYVGSFPTADAALSARAAFLADKSPA